MSIRTSSEKVAYFQIVNTDKDRKGRLPPVCQYGPGQRRSPTFSLSIRTRTEKVVSIRRSTEKVAYLQFVKVGAVVSSETVVHHLTHGKQRSHKA